jgi:hypothetical protein
VNQEEPTEQLKDTTKDVIVEIAMLPRGAIISEAGLARMLGKCRDSIRNAEERGELPRHFRWFGKPSWIAGLLTDHLEELQKAESRKFRKHSA